MSTQETALEKQYIGGQGNLIEFVKKSEKIGEYTLVDGDILDYLKKAAQCDDDAGRKLALILIDKIDKADFTITSLKSSNLLDTMGNTIAVGEEYQCDALKIRKIKGSSVDNGSIVDCSSYYFRSPNELNLFWAGDSIITEEVKQFLLKTKPKIIITHSSTAVWNDEDGVVMDEMQTVELCELLPRSIIIATPTNSDEHSVVARTQLREYADNRGVCCHQLVIPKEGEVLEFVKLMRRRKSLV